MQRKTLSSLRKLLPLFVVVTFTFGATLPLGAHAEIGEPSVTPALNEKKSKVFDTFYIANNVSLSKFKKIHIEEISAEFDKDWLRDNRMEASKRYREKILKRYPSLFAEALKKATEKNTAFNLTDESGPDALSLSIKMDELKIYAPDGRNPSTKKLVKNAGKATLIVEMKNASGEVVGKVVDTRETRDRSPNEYEMTNSLLNERDFKWLMKIWARYVLEHVENN